MPVSPSPQDDTPPAVASAQDLAQACRALWLATLGLMTAFMQMQAPAHRLLLARRISGNLGLLSGQPCFSSSARERFSRLARRWHDRAETVAAEMDGRSGRGGLLRGLWPLPFRG